MSSWQTLAIGAFLLSTTMVASNDCPAEKHLTKRYHVYNTPVTYMEAWRQCLDRDQRLATITSCRDSARIQEAISKSSNPQGAPWFIAGTDEGKEGSFVWISTNEPVQYQNFYQGQPDNNGGVENCLEIGRWGGVLWNDVPCGWRQRFICEDFVMI